jgi:hypothetical protein
VVNFEKEKNLKIQKFDGDQKKKWRPAAVNSGQ